MLKVRARTALATGPYEVCATFLSVIFSQKLFPDPAGPANEGTTIYIILTSVICYP